MRSGLLTCGVFFLLAVPLGADQPLALRVSPVVARAPTTVEIRATVEPSPENRTLKVVAESDGYYRSSQVDLGSETPSLWVIHYRDLPRGSYVVTVTLATADGHTRSITKRMSVM